MLRYIIYLIAFILISVSTDARAQDKINSVKELVITLKQKVLLNDDQTNSVEKVLIELVNKSKSQEDKTSLIIEAQKKVESYLDKRQQLKYDIIKNEWWKQVQTLL